MRLTPWLEEFGSDVRFALRQLRASPGFTFVAALTLALGIGANSAIFALADAALLRPLPFADPDRLVMLSERRPTGTRGSVNPVEFLDWSERNRSFAAMAAVTGSGRVINHADGTAEQVPAQAVTSRFFDVLGITPIAGRTFRATDDGPVPSVVVLGEDVWRSRFGADATIVGRTITLDGQAATVIGIVPAELRLNALGDKSELWTLLNTPADRGPAQRYAHYLQVIGRLKADVALETADADMNAIGDALAQEMPATNTGHGVMLEALRDGLIGRDVRLTATLLLAVVGFVLLLCCANVANLLLSRTIARGRELAVRSALGAGRRRIVAQLLTESLVLALIGGVLGAGIAAAILHVAPSMIPPALLPPTVTFGFDGRVMVFCAAIALAVTMAFGLAPAWQATDVSLVQAMGISGRSATGRGARFRSVLATGEIAVAVLLLCGAGLLLRTLVALERVDPGHHADEALTAIVNVPMSSSADAMRRFYSSVEQEIRSLPGVRDVAWGSGLPFDGWWYGQSFQIEGDAPRRQADRDNATYQMVSASYFSTLGIAIRRGRGFTDRDTAASVQVAVVNEAFVRRHLGGRDPLGVRISVNAMVMPAAAVVREIVGVVDHVKGLPDQTEPEPQIYVPHVQNPWWSATLVVRPSSGPAEALTSAVRGAVARVDKNRPLTRIRTLAEIERGATARWRFRAQLVVTFALLALVVAIVGVFGVLAHAVQERTREFGVRMALGATSGHVMSLVMAAAARVIVVGITIGLAAAAAVSRSISAFLFGVEPFDAATFASVACVLIVTASLAIAAPALRATRVDPVVAFRNE